MTWEQNTGPENMGIYQAQLETFISSPLTPDNILAYADNALGQRVHLLNRLCGYCVWPNLHVWIVDTINHITTDLLVSTRIDKLE